MKTFLICCMTCIGLGMLLSACTSTEEIALPPRVSNTDPSFTSVHNCSVLNSPEDDFAPWISRDGRRALVTSNRRLSPAERKLSTEFLYGEKLLSTETSAPLDSTRIGLGLHHPDRWSAPSPLLEEASGIFNKGTAMFETGSVSYYSSSYGTGGRGGTDIWLHGPSGSAPVNEINSAWWDAHPALSPDGQMLVFASDRVGRDPSVSDTGRRAPHLYFAMKTPGGSWSEPQPLPAPVNSSSAEISPWFDSDGTLYFATERRGSFDIATTRLLSDNIWSDPSFFKEPINTSANECFAVLSPDRSEMLFTSDRAGGFGGYDIWSADRPTCVRFEGVVRLRTIGKKGDTLYAPGSSIRMTIREMHSSTVISSGTTSADGTFAPSTCLRPKTPLSIVTDTMSCFLPGSEVNLVVPVPQGDSDVLRHEITLERKALPVFEPKNDSIPFFVTGYWYPNTGTNLTTLLNEWPNGKLRNANFIETDSFDYRTASVEVENWFSKLYKDIDDMLIPMMNNCYENTDTLVLHVYGHVDPRGLAWGKYEDVYTARTVEMVIAPGAVMQKQDGNTKLANLRGYYSMRMIDADMSARSEHYATLRAQNRIQLRAHGDDVGYGRDGSKKGPLDDPFKRKFRVVVELREGK